MKLTFKNGKMGFLTILAIGVYIVLITSTVFTNANDFQVGYNLGREKREIDYNSDQTDKKKETVFFVTMKPKENVDFLPDSIMNLKTAEKVVVLHNKTQIFSYAFGEHKSSVFSVYKIIQIPISLIIMAILILIPIVFIKLNLRLRKNVVFDKKNIRYMRKIGFLLIGYYLLLQFWYWLVYKANLLMFEFENYVIQFEQADLIWLLLGVVVLLFAEVLAQGSKIKEEQDLTI